MPFAYGGGVKTLAQISNLIKVGAEKVVICIEGIKSETFLMEAVKEFGSSTIVFCSITNGYL